MRCTFGQFGSVFFYRIYYYYLLVVLVVVVVVDVCGVEVVGGIAKPGKTREQTGDKYRRQDNMTDRR